MQSFLMDSSLKNNGCKSTNGDCQRSKRRAINKTNGNGTTPTRNLLRRVINNLSGSQGTKSLSIASQAPQNEVGGKATTRRPNFSNHISKNQIKIDDDDDELRNNKKHGAEYYATVNSINYEPLNVRQNNASSANNSSSNIPIMGHAPKTLPILQALNELNLSIDVNVHEDGYEEDFPVMKKNPTTVSSLNHDNNPGSLHIACPPAPAPRPSICHLVDGQGQAILPSPNRHTSLENCSSKINASTPLPGTRKYLKNSRASSSPRRHLLSSSNNIRSLNTTPVSSPSKLIQKTPSWIWKIFHFTRNGRLDLLKEAVYGLDLTLIRHLVDAKGNNLLHCSARRGHIHILEWLVSILEDQFEAALNDQNVNGNNVILTALKNTQLGCLQWLIVNTITGSNALTAKDGKKSLLHYAAKYNLVDAVNLLCEFHVQYQITLDIQDSSFFTPLHTAAKFGNIAVAQVLIQFGADPLCQTELGCKPSDLALKRHHQECTSYFRMAEAAASLGNDLHSLLNQFTTLQTQFETLRTHFRDVLRVSKCLTKERNELIKHFPFVGSKSSPEETAASTALLLGGTTNNGVRFSDLEHKLVQAEHVWKQIETRQSAETPSYSFMRRTAAQHDDLFGVGTDITKQAYILQKYLAQTQPVLQRSRHSSGSVLSSSEEDSSNNGRSSDDDDEFDEERLREPTYHNTTPCDLNKAKSCSYLPSASTNTPWLLPSTEPSILTSLSPDKRNVQNSPNLSLEVFGKTSPLKNSSDFTPRRESTPIKNSSFNSSTSIGIPTSPRTPKTLKLVSSPGESGADEAVSAAVIEVIEPICTRPNKSTTKLCNSKPTQNTCPNNTTYKTFTNVQPEELFTAKLSDDWFSSENSAHVETKTGGSIGPATDNEMPIHDTNKFTAQSIGNNAVTQTWNDSACERITRTQETCSNDVSGFSTQENECSNTGISQVIRIHSSPKPKRRPRRREVVYYPFSVPVSEFETEFHQSTEACNQVAQSNQCHTSESYKTCDTCGSRESSCTCLQNPNSLSQNFTVLSLQVNPSNNDEMQFYEEKLHTPTTQPRNSNSTPQRKGQHQSTFSTRLAAFPGPEIRFPVPYPDLLKNQTDNFNRIACTSSSITHVPLSSFQPPPPSGPSTYPSMSESRNTELPPVTLGWPVVDLPQCSPLESGRSLNGHQSPSPSETESALAPPPSQVSQSSDMSKTESVQGRPSTTTVVAPAGRNSGRESRNSNSIIINYCQIVTAEPKSTHDSTLEMMMSGSKRDLVERDKGSCDNQQKTDDKIDNNEARESMEDGVDSFALQSSITQAAKTTHSTPTISLDVSTKPIHNNKVPIKAKPWYEVEVSDDEDEIFLRVARARAKANSDEDESLGNEEQRQPGEHRCGSTHCSQFNCPNFV